MAARRVTDGDKDGVQGCCDDDDDLMSSSFPDGQKKIGDALLVLTFDTLYTNSNYGSTITIRLIAN